MYVSTQTIDFLEFILIGAIIACVFDFFRGYRKLKKVNTVSVIIQDIIYFVIVTIIIIFSIIKLLDSQIRLYIFIAILLGCCMYFCTLSKFVTKIFMLFFSMSKEIFLTLILPILLDIQIFIKISKFFKKIWKKCCKMLFYMISFICSPLKKGKTKILAKLNRKKVKTKEVLNL